MKQYKIKEKLNAKNKYIIILATFLLLSLFTALAITYAWFKDYVNSGSSTVTTGRLTVGLTGLDSNGLLATDGNVVLFNSANSIVVPGEVINIQNVDATFGTGEDATNIDFVLRARVLFEGDESLDTNLTSTLTGLNANFGMTEPSDGWYYFREKIAALTENLNLITNGTLTIPNTYEIPADQDKTLIITLEVEVCQADWTSNGVLAPAGANYTASEIADVFAAVEEEVYTATPYNIISDANSLEGDDLVNAVNSAENSVVYVPLTYDEFDTEVNAASNELDSTKTIFLYEKDAVVSSSTSTIQPHQVALSKRVNLGSSNQEVTISSIYQVADAASAVAIPEYIENITVSNLADSAFVDNLSLTGITFSRYVRTIGDYAFAGCENLTSVVFSNINRSYCNTIGDYAFADSGITSIVIPRSVTTIGDRAFAGTFDLSSISVYGGYYFRAVNNVLYNYSQTTLINYASAKTDSSYSMPSSVTKICDFAFDPSLQGTLNSMTVSPNLKTIGESGIPSWLATTSANKIKYITSGSSAYVIGTTDSSVTNTNISNFWSEMTSAGKTVKALGAWAFNDASNVTSITLPTSLLGIGWGAFANTAITSLTIPSSVSTISPGAFTGANSISAFSVSGGTYYKATNGVLFNYEGSYLIRYPVAKTGTSYSIPSIVTRVEYGAFCNVSNLTSITFAGSICSYIGDEAFVRTSISSFTIPSSVTKIYSATFGDCQNLTSIVIPQSITSIGHYAFSNCTSLSSVTFSGTSKCASIADCAFENTISLMSITLPASCIYVHPNAFFGSGVTSW